MAKFIQRIRIGWLYLCCQFSYVCYSRELMYISIYYVIAYTGGCMTHCMLTAHLSLPITVSSCTLPPCRLSSCIKCSITSDIAICAWQETHVLQVCTFLCLNSTFQLLRLQSNPNTDHLIQHCINTDNLSFSRPCKISTRSCEQRQIAFNIPLNNMAPVAATPAPVASNNSPPEAWNVLFPSVQYNPEDRRAILIRELVYGFSSAAGWARLQAGLQRYGDGRFSLDISFRSLQELCPVDGDVSIALELQPVEALACISAAAHQVGLTDHQITSCLQAP